MVLIVRFVAAHPVASLVGGTLVLGAAIYGSVLWQRKRAREAQRTWQLEVARSRRSLATTCTAHASPPW
ncbi:hypothetical protein [Amycolatopsis sp. NPDC051102]|uniref:hypothetical protein n=1 Tax=Amycolatopsis sp. NPDC051102 TaxID=3155163 RepID=UPI00342C251A